VGSLTVAGFPASGVGAVARALGSSLAPPGEAAQEVRAVVGDLGPLVHAVRARSAVVLVVHDPSDVLVTLLATEPHLSPGGSLLRWVRYHQVALALASRSARPVNVVTYAQACADLAGVVARLAPATPLRPEGVVEAQDGLVREADSGAAGLRSDARLAWALGVVGRPSLAARRVAADALWLRARHLAGLRGPDLGRTVAPDPTTPPALTGAGDATAGLQLDR